MDSPVRQYLKQKDYLRHKLFRKIKRRLRALRELDVNAPLNEMKRRVRLKRYAGGKDDEYYYQTQNTETGDVYNVHPSAIGAKNIYGEITLPDIEVRPDWQLRQYLLESLGGNERELRQIAEETFAHKQAREFLTGTEKPANHELIKIAQVANAAGNPAVVYDDDALRAFYDQRNNEIHLADPDIYNRPTENYIDELSHAYLFYNNDFAERYNAQLKRRDYYDPDEPYADKYGIYENLYTRPGSLEYDAHLPIKESINDYKFSDDNISNFLNIVNNNRKPKSQEYYENLGYGNVSGYGPIDFVDSNKYNYITSDAFLLALPGIGGFTPPSIYNYNKGKDSGIHINPKNRGKFNALKKRTGKTTELLTHSKNPLTRKRAIFAQNARKWHHK